MRVVLPRVGALAHFLKNRFYLGEVVYRGETMLASMPPSLIVPPSMLSSEFDGWQQLGPTITALGCRPAELKILSVQVNAIDQHSAVGTDDPLASKRLP
jgi:hypothetical protein